MPLDDDEIRARFDALRTKETGDAPEFRSFIARAEHAHSGPERGESRARRRPAAWFALSLATAATIAVVAGLSVRGRLDRARLPSLSTWRSPTAVFLRTPGAELLQSPDVYTSVLDRVTLTTVQPKGE